MKGQIAQSRAQARKNSEPMSFYTVQQLVQQHQMQASPHEKSNLDGSKLSSGQQIVPFQETISLQENETNNGFHDQGNLQTASLRDITGTSLRASYTSNKPKRVKIEHKARQTTSSDFFSRKSAKGNNINDVLQTLKVKTTQNRLDYTPDKANKFLWKTPDATRQAQEKASNQQRFRNLQPTSYHAFDKQILSSEHRDRGLKMHGQSPKIRPVDVHPVYHHQTHSKSFSTPTKGFVQRKRNSIQFVQNPQYGKEMGNKNLDNIQVDLQPMHPESFVVTRSAISQQDKPYSLLQQDFVQLQRELQQERSMRREYEAKLKLLGLTAQETPAEGLIQQQDHLQTKLSEAQQNLFDTKQRLDQALADIDKLQQSLIKIAAERNTLLRENEALIRQINDLKSSQNSTNQTPSMKLGPLNQRAAHTLAQSTEIEIQLKKELDHKNQILYEINSKVQERIAKIELSQRKIQESKLARHREAEAKPSELVKEEVEAVQRSVQEIKLEKERDVALEEVRELKERLNMITKTITDFIDRKQKLQKSKQHPGASQNLDTKSKRSDERRSGGLRNRSRSRSRSPGRSSRRDRDRDMRRPDRGVEQEVEHYEKQIIFSSKKYGSGANVPTSNSEFKFANVAMSQNLGYSGAEIQMGQQSLGKEWRYYKRELDAKRRKAKREAERKAEQEARARGRGPDYGRERDRFDRFGSRDRFPSRGPPRDGRSGERRGGYGYHR